MKNLGKSGYLSIEIFFKVQQRSKTAITRKQLLHLPEYVGEVLDTKSEFDIDQIYRIERKIGDEYKIIGHGARFCYYLEGVTGDEVIDKIDDWYRNHGVQWWKTMNMYKVDYLK